MKPLGKNLISIVVPLYNEEEVINKFYERLVKVLNNIDFNYEVIFVNDGSTDNTDKLIKDFIKSRKSNSKKKII